MRRWFDSATARSHASGREHAAPAGRTRSEKAAPHLPFGRQPGSLPRARILAEQLSILPGMGQTPRGEPAAVAVKWPRSWAAAAPTDRVANGQTKVTSPR